MQRSLILVLVGVLITVGCGVPQEEHDEVVDDLENTQADLVDTRQEKADLEEEIEQLDQQIEQLEGEKSELQAALEEAEGDVELYESETGSLEEALEASRDELDELREARRQTEERLAEYREVAEQLASMIEAGQLSVEIRDGRMVINLDDDILFASGRTDIRSDGQSALEELGGVLEEIDDREFLVAGHTDNVPVGSSRFDSNWELSTARAVEVVRFLQDQGVPAGNMAAAGYGEHDPIASNDNEDGRALNRRIEIVLMPSLDELPELPNDVLDEQQAAKDNS